jgi:hypothetical protein
VVQYGAVAAGQTVSSAFELKASDRALLVGVSSHASMTWFLAAAASDGTFTRVFDPWNCYSGALFVGTGGAWVYMPHVPTTTVRIEAQAALTATTSFCVVEAIR